MHGTGGEIPASEADLDARQSGTTARFLLPMLALGHGRFRLDGDAQLRARPLGPGIDALRQLGVRIVEEGDAGHLPVVVEADGLAGGSVTIDGEVSSQFLSGLMLAAPCARGDLTIEVTGRQVSRPYVEMTTAVARQFGATGGASGYRAADVTIEPDASAASYFFAAAAITGGRVTVPDLGSASVQGDLRFVDVLSRMGAEVDRARDATTVRGRPLSGGHVDLADLSDTAPTLAVVAPFASSPTEATGIGFIRGEGVRPHRGGRHRAAPLRHHRRRTARRLRREPRRASRGDDRDVRRPPDRDELRVARLGDAGDHDHRSRLRREDLPRLLDPP